MFRPLFPSFLPSYAALDPSLTSEAVPRVLYTRHYTAVYTRMLQSTGCSRASDLATLLGVRPWEIARARRKRRIPNEWFLRLCFQQGISPYWLLSGHGSECLPRVPDRASRQGRALADRIDYALCLYDEALATACSLTFLTRLVSRHTPDGECS